MDASIDEQVDAVRRHYPQFTVLTRLDWAVVLEGTLRPLSKTYRVRILYITRSSFDEARLSHFAPRVWILEPALELLHRHTGKLVEHVFWRPAWPLEPDLCLYDPALEQWRRNELIAETTIPWTIDWLVSYEGWRVTGNWSGGGRDHNSPPEGSPCPSHSSPGALPARSPSVDSRLRDLEIEISTSSALMVATSRASPRHPSWRELRRACWEEEVSLSTLTSLRAFLREASSLLAWPRLELATRPAFLSSSA